MRSIGMDVHRQFAQIAMVEDGICRDEGRIGCTPEELRAWADTLGLDDEVALEATGNSDAIAMLLRPLVSRVVVSNPKKTRAIAEAKVKTDKVDARILAQLLAADFLPAVWLPDDQTRMLRRMVSRRTHLVRQRTRLKNQVHAVLARNLAPTCPASDLFGKAGRVWLARQVLPVDERRSVEALIRQLDFHGEELAVVDRDLASQALDDPVVARLMTIPGVDAIVAMSIVAAVGDFSRFSSPDKLVSYLGLNPQGSPVWRNTGQSRTDHQSRTCPSPRDARRGRVLGGKISWSASGILQPDQSSPWVPSRHRRHRPQDDGAVLASGNQGRGLRLRPTEPECAQTPKARTGSRRPTSSRTSRRGIRLQRQTTPPPRTRDRRTVRTGL